jgi:hypothetical protein
MVLPVPGGDGDRLQHLRAVLPCEVTVTAATHPLCGDRLSALSFKRWRGELLLVVVLPDASRGTIRADATNVFGESSDVEGGPPTTVTVEGLRQLRVVVDAASERGRRRRRGRPKPWKVVRHAKGDDPLARFEWVYTSHTTELAARRAASRLRSQAMSRWDPREYDRWRWSVINDPDGVLVNDR